MKNRKTSAALAILLCVALLLAACSNGGNSPAEPVVITETETVETFDPALFADWFYAEGTWRSPVNRVAATDFVGGFLEDASGRPSYAEIEQIMNTASLASSARGRTPWYMIVVTDPDVQGAITQSDEPGIPRATSEGTVTVLIFGEWLIDEAYRTDDVKTFFPREGYINVGILAGYLNIAAISLGYSTRMFMTLASPNAPLGERWPEVEGFLDGRYYTWGSNGDVHSTENMKFAIAIVIGTIDETVEAGVTVAQRPHNWSFWTPGEDGAPPVAIARPLPMPLPLEDLEDGVFTGAAPGFHGDIVVEVTVYGGEITAIEILEHEEDELFMSLALEGVNGIPGVIAQILQLQQITGIDAVTGATDASEGIVRAVAAALGL